MIHSQELHVSDATLSAGRSFFTTCHASRLEFFLRQKICPISCTSDSGHIAQAASATRQIFFVRPSFFDFFFSVQWDFGVILMCCRWNATVLPDESGRVPWRVTQNRGCFGGPAAARRGFGALRAAAVATSATWSTYGQGW